MASRLRPRAALDPYYDLVAYMLDIAPITASSHLGIPPKAAWMKQVAARLGCEAKFCYPNIAVDFFRTRRRASQQVRRRAERMHYCGEYDIGCNVLAKNTRGLNYLAMPSSAAPTSRRSARSFVSSVTARAISHVQKSRHRRRR